MQEARNRPETDHKQTKKNGFSPAAQKARPEKTRFVVLKQMLERLKTDCSLRDPVDPVDPMQPMDPGTARYTIRWKYS